VSIRACVERWACSIPSRNASSAPRTMFFSRTTSDTRRPTPDPDDLSRREGALSEDVQGLPGMACHPVGTGKTLFSPILRQRATARPSRGQKTATIACSGQP